ncbi:MAG: FkbM family methyltransferase [Paracoccus sp. (in: a-proteobacteria)]|nr:FkbM family methyltransferase [Paracoccus sp. (in: a-proteobacteria)]
MSNPRLDRLKLLCELVAPARLTRILDIGANPVHAPPYQMMLDAGLCEVWGFEPAPDAYARLQEIKGPNEHYIQAAVGDGETHELRMFGEGGFNSTLDANLSFVDDYLGPRFGRGMRETGRLSFRTERLDDLDLPTPDLLKIDIQGGEVRVFDHGAHRLAGTGAIITEVAMVPLYRDQPLIGDQMNVLRGQGFEFHKFTFLKGIPLASRLTAGLKRRQIANQAVDGDAVFLRRDLVMRNAAPDDLEAVRHLALTADAVFDSLDVVCRCLEILQGRVEMDQTLLRTYLDSLT